MNYKQKIIELLNRYIEEESTLKDNYDRTIALKESYEELLYNLEKDYSFLKRNKLPITFLFTRVYKNNIYLDEFNRIISDIGQNEESQQKFKQLYNSILMEYKELANEMQIKKEQNERKRYLIQSAYRVRTALKYNLPINQNKYDLINTKRIISYFETTGIITNKEELLLINEVEMHNRRVSLNDNSDESERSYTNSLYDKIPNILNSGFQEHDVIEVDEERKTTLDRFVKEILNYIEYFTDFPSLTESIERYSNYNLDDNEYNYIIVKILDHYLNELMTFYELLIDKDVYTKRSDRIEIIKNYYNILDKYILLRKYYDNINIYEEINSPEDEEELNEETTGETKELIYSHSQNQNKGKIITDMKDVPHEYYQTVKELLNNFRNNKLSKKEIKHLTNNRKINKFIELKYDQVRIVLKHIKDNIYCIMGIGVKKSDNDITMYINITNRTIPNISTPEKLAFELTIASQTEEELTKLVDEKSRKGTR